VVLAFDLTGAVSLAAVVVAALVSVLGVVGFQNRRARTTAIRSAFGDVVTALASTEAERQLAGAVLLRRFFDSTSELGMRDWRGRRSAPYAAEARSVLAAVLRGVPTGDLQKLLADGLAYAPTLAHADLQRTNLQDAYLAPRHEGGSLEGADFYRADLSGASLKNTVAAGAIFYQVRAEDTIFRGADLRGANFFEANLARAVFTDARLDGATFKGASNVPPELSAQIDGDGVYTSAEPAPRPDRSGLPAPRQVFVSLPSARSARQESQWRRVSALLEANQIGLVQLLQRDYPVSSALVEITRRMSGCAGAVIFGFRDETASDGSDETTAGVTPWTHIEAGVAHGLGLRLLLVRESGVTAGAFADAVTGHRAVTLTIDEPWDEESAQRVVATWARDVATG